MLRLNVLVDPALDEASLTAFKQHYRKLAAQFSVPFTVYVLKDAVGGVFNSRFVSGGTVEWLNKVGLVCKHIIFWLTCCRVINLMLG